jgi:hypothetical protein
MCLKSTIVAIRKAVAGPLVDPVRLQRYQLGMEASLRSRGRTLGALQDGRSTDMRRTRSAMLAEIKYQPLHKLHRASDCYRIMRYSGGHPAYRQYWDAVAAEGYRKLAY